MKEMVTLSKKEQSRLIVLNGIEMGRVTAREASKVLGLSLRHVRRILRRIERRAPQHWHMVIEGVNLTMP
jgi:alkylated DNA nucleotide flippase Atl1